MMTSNRMPICVVCRHNFIVLNHLFYHVMGRPVAIHVHYIGHNGGNLKPGWGAVSYSSMSITQVKIYLS